MPVVGHPKMSFEPTKAGDTPCDFSSVSLCPANYLGATSHPQLELERVPSACLCIYTNRSVSLTRSKVTVRQRTDDSVAA